MIPLLIYSLLYANEKLYIVYELELLDQPNYTLHLDAFLNLMNRIATGKAPAGAAASWPYQDLCCDAMIAMLRI